MAFADSLQAEMQMACKSLLVGSGERKAIRPECKFANACCKGAKQRNAKKSKGAEMRFAAFAFSGCKSLARVRARAVVITYRVLWG
jgi:fructose-specific component phosphotransferase system IIB-like protein